MQGPYMEKIMGRAGVKESEQVVPLDVNLQ
jgi:hypothetical protein